MAGVSRGSYMNIAVSIALYATVCKELHLPLRYLLLLSSIATAMAIVYHMCIANSTSHKWKEACRCMNPCGSKGRQSSCLSCGLRVVALTNAALTSHRAQMFSMLDFAATIFWMAVGCMRFT